MSGKQTKLVDLGKAAQRLTGAMLAADERKRAMIKEISKNFVRQGFSPWMAEKLAIEKYNQLHK